MNRRQFFQRIVAAPALAAAPAVAEAPQPTHILTVDQASQTLELLDKDGHVLSRIFFDKIKPLSRSRT